MALEPLKIPQNVYIEDRIVGPITLRQIIVMGIGGGISYISWGMIAKANGGASPLPLTIMCAIPFVISAAFAFVKINDLSLLRIGFLMLEKMNKPSIRTLTPRQGFSIHIRTFTEPARVHQGLSPEKQQSHQHIDDLTAILDRPLRKTQAEIPFTDLVGNEADEVETEGDTPSKLPRLPVNKDRISVSALPSSERPEEGATPKGSVSIFRDIVAK